MKFRLSPRLALVIIAAMFILPLAVAWMMYSGAIEYRPGTTRNLGQLVQPPVPIAWENDIEILSSDAMRSGADSDFSGLNGHWVILHTIEDPCQAGCVDSVTALRQVHRASGRNQNRIRLTLLLPDAEDRQLAGQLREIYPSFDLVRPTTDEFLLTLEDIARSLSDSGAVYGNSYLVDPLGNIMMFYEAGSDPNDLKKDLKRLLTWSKLDEQS
jgi:hypothetical protein